MIFSVLFFGLILESDDFTAELVKLIFGNLDNIRFVLDVFLADGVELLDIAGHFAVLSQRLVVGYAEILVTSCVVLSDCFIVFAYPCCFLVRYFYLQEGQAVFVSPLDGSTCGESIADKLVQLIDAQLEVGHVAQIGLFLRAFVFCREAVVNAGPLSLHFRQLSRLHGVHRIICMGERGHGLDICDQLLGLVVDIISMFGRLTLTIPSMDVADKGVCFLFISG